jgi:flagellar biosynthesis/type III secretory pathway protein FliH
VTPLLRHAHRFIGGSQSTATAIAGEEHYHYTQEDLMTYAEELLQEGMEKGLEKGLERGLEQGLERGIQKGQLQGKKDVLTRLLSRRFELTEAERDLIASSDDPDALDAALDQFAVATEKASVLSKLRR